MVRDLRQTRLARAAAFWSAKRLRPLLLILLAMGLAMLLVWLPGSARLVLWLALRAHAGLVALFSVFALVALSLIWSAGQRLDARIFTFLNMRIYPAWLDRCMWLVTQLGSMLAAFIAVGASFLLGYRSLAVEILLGSLALWLLVESIKMVSDRDRPFLTLERARVVGWREIGDSFPSGHTSQIFFMIILFVHNFQLGLGASLALYALATLVGFTRIYVGAHYPRDVIAGMVLGSVWGILAALLDPYWLLIRI